jgi:hypothetical protein
MGGRGMFLKRFLDEKGDFLGEGRTDIFYSKKKEMAIRTTAYEHYEATIAMLNHSMGLCLPLR